MTKYSLSFSLHVFETYHFFVVAVFPTLSHFALYCFSAFCDASLSSLHYLLHVIVKFYVRTFTSIFLKSRYISCTFSWHHGAFGWNI